MPYIITTTQRGYYCMHCGLPGTCPNDAHARITRHAVATLEEARELLWERFRVWRPANEPDYHAQVTALTDDGGTIGPLPDGTVIEVEQVTIAHLWVQGTDTDYDTATEAEIIDGYNNKETA